MKIFLNLQRDIFVQPAHIVVSSKFAQPTITMRYSIMLQIVTGITLILVGGGALFAWIQNRPVETTEVNENRNLSTISSD
ncbi:hypothetical protein [Chlorogloeopsis sp. ULAP02]|uniref:hypothetical protein n=1 Tax=Chlorogloeopsis sp. ULAP02 TaxID=3107926 RepID=UPI003134809C